MAVWGLSHHRGRVTLYQQHLGVTSWYFFLSAVAKGGSVFVITARGNSQH